MTSSDFRINKFYYNHRLSILFADSYEHIPSLALITYKDDTSKAVMAISAQGLRDGHRITRSESFGGLNRFPHAQPWGWLAIASTRWRDSDMNKDRIVGAAKQAKGAIKDGAGKILGNPELEAEGKGDKIEGTIQNAIGRGKDALKH